MGTHVPSSTTRVNVRVHRVTVCLTPCRSTSGPSLLDPTRRSSRHPYPKPSVVRTERPDSGRHRLLHFEFSDRVVGLDHWTLSSDRGSLTARLLQGL